MRSSAVYVEWLAQAAPQDHGPAQLSLGRAYASGNGTNQDYVQAYKWISLELKKAKHLPAPFPP